MTMPAIAAAKARIDADTASREFITCVRLWAATGGSPQWAAKMAEAKGASRRLERIFERASPLRLGVDESPTGASDALTDYAQIESSFAATLRRDGAFDAMRPFTLPGALRQHFAVNSSVVVAEAIGENELKSVFDMSISADQSEPWKIAAIVALTKDLWRIGGPNVDRMIDIQMRRGIVAGTDLKALADLVALNSPIASTGGLLEDLSNLLRAVSFGSDAKLFFIAEPDIVAQLAVSQSPVGTVAYPSIGVGGGTVGNITLLATDGLASGVALLVDATQLVTASLPISVQVLEHASIALDSDSPSTLTSLWQANMVAVRAERWVMLHALRETCCASLSGVSYAGGSPS